ncbi:MAG: sugar transferase, partial [Lactococcus sp.]
MKKIGREMENINGSYINLVEKQEEVPFKKFSLLERVIKRSLDILGGLVGTCLLLIGGILLFIPYHLCPQKDRGPMFYRQKRYGRNGRIFYILKFRTMIVDAE